VNVVAIAVVVPAHNEEVLLPAALDALAVAGRHPDLAGVRITTVVVADSCRDLTAEIAARAGAVVVPTRSRNPGRARAIGVERALRELGAPADRTWIAVTDADSTVPADWLAYHHARAAEGWDAVVGTVEIPPCALSAPHRLGYEATRPAQGIAWHHPHVHGANLGVRARAYRGVGGFRPLDVGEDRALVAALDRHGHRVLRTPDCPVLTSARLRARAHGGFADHLATLPGPVAGREAAG
jgi:glycosyltransferase involved in cell wall biosynthesis